MIPNAVYLQTLNKNLKVLKDGSAKIVAQFRIGVAPYFG
jgi:hypothetical protein